MKNLCSCGSLIDFEDCCSPFLIGERMPANCEQLMRSRFSAFASRQYHYIIETQRLIADESLDYATLATAQADVKWLKLEVLKSSENKTESTGNVEFKAWFRHLARVLCLHEESIFTRMDKRWMYTDAVFSNTATVASKSLCPCGSGKKTKRCCAKNS